MNKSRKVQLLISLVFLISISAILSQSPNVSESDEKNSPNPIFVEEKPESPKKSGYWTVNYIHVNNNWTLTNSTYTWCHGAGTWSNPYVIENVTINAANSPTGSGIYIQNSPSNIYFIIRNCSVTNARNKTYSYDGDSGIRLYSVYNGKIIENNCSYNNYSGISLYNSNNNSITGNIVDYNINPYLYYGVSYSFGIYLYNSDNNSINLNHAFSNGQDGILVYEHSTGNNITYNNASYNGRSGVMLLNFVTNNWVAHNKLTENGGSLVSLAGIHSESCDGNYLMYNNVSNGKSGAEGIYFLQSNNNTIVGNIANDNDGYGIDVERGSHNIISQNIVNNNQYGIRIYSDVGMSIYYCVNNTISKNTVKFNSLDGVRIDSTGGGFCKNNTISNNLISNNTLSGIHTSNLVYNTTIFNNTIEGNLQHGLCLESASEKSIILNNTIKYNQENGIYMYSCRYNILKGNIIDHNGLHGIYLYYSDNNTIIDNGNSFNSNGFCGIYLKNSDWNYLIRNTANYNQYGIYLNQSNYNQIINNICEGNTIQNVYISNDSIGNYIFPDSEDARKPGGSSNDDDDNSDNESIDVLIIIILLVIIGSLVVVSALLVRRVQLKKSSMKGKVPLNIKADSLKKKYISVQSRPTKPLQNRTTSVLKKDSEDKEISPSWEELGATLLTSEEIAELKKTEKEMILEKQDFTCVVHRGKVSGNKFYRCKHCNTVYCEECAKVLRIKGEKCWTCENEIDIQVTKSDQKDLTEKKVIKSVEGFINERKQLLKK